MKPANGDFPKANPLSITFPDGFAIDSPEAYNALAALAYEFGIFDHPENFATFVQIARSLDPNDYDGIHAISLLELYSEDSPWEALTPEIIEELKELFVGKVQFSGDSFIGNIEYYERLFESGLLRDERVKEKFKDVVYAIDVSSLIRRCEMEYSNSYGHSVKVGYEELLASLSALGVFEIRPMLLPEMIRAYASVRDWDRYHGSSLIAGIVRYKEKYPNPVKGLAVKALADAAKASGVVKVYQLYQSGLVPKNTELSDELFFFISDASREEISRGVEDGEATGLLSCALALIEASPEGRIPVNIPEADSILWTL